MWMLIAGTMMFGMLIRSDHDRLVDCYIVMDGIVKTLMPSAERSRGKLMTVQH